jgi:hypothetical protein
MAISECINQVTRHNFKSSGTRVYEERLWNVISTVNQFKRQLEDRTRICT